MAVRFYTNPSEYIASAADTTARLARLRAVQLALENSLLLGAGTANMEDYSFDDGQSKISTTYRSTKEIMDALDRIEAVINRIVSSCQGRKTILRDQNSGIL